MAEKKRHEEDLISMSLGDHLEELRARMILMLLGVFVGLIFGLFVGKRFIHLLEEPYYHAVERIYKKEKGTDSDNSSTTPKVLVRFHIDEKNEDIMGSLKPGDSFLAYMEFCEGEPNNLNVVPPPPFLSTDTSSLGELKTLKPSEGFVIYLKVSLVFGIVLTSPWLFWQIWAFVSAGLYTHEKKFMRVVSPVSAILFIFGCVFFLLLVAPNVMYFFIRFDRSMGAQSNWTLQYYMDMVLVLTLVFGLAFQSPIAIVFSERMGLVTVEAMTKARKYVFLGCFVVSAMVTPPEVVSQISLALPLYILFEGSIIVCRIWRRRRVKSK